MMLSLVSSSSRVLSILFILCSIADLNHALMIQSPYSRYLSSISAATSTGFTTKRMKKNSCLHKRSRRTSPFAIFAISNDNNEEEREAGSKIPCLPPIGASSFDGESSDDMDTINLGGESQNVGFVGQKFELQYTCKICETRNSHKVSRLAYRQGVVIAVCKGCMSKHLIADNLGWSKYIGGFEGEETNIEEYMEANGRGDDVNRVSPDVFDLEKVLHLDSPLEQSTSGSSEGLDLD